MNHDRIQTDRSTWAFDSKQFDTELRVYRVYGDVTDQEALEEAVERLAEKYGCTRARLYL